MYELWYGYIKPKYQNNAKLCYVDTDSNMDTNTDTMDNFIINVKTENVYQDIADEV